MYIKSLQVSQFRSWTYKEVKIPPRGAYLRGPNGSGKTSLLEAIRYLSVGRSFQTYRNEELVNWEGSFFSIRGEFKSKNNSAAADIAISYNSQSRSRQVKVDSEPLEKLSQLQGLFPTVIFYPQQVEIIKGGPSCRRRFLNELLSQLSPQYLQQLQRYKRNISQRNTLLKQKSPDRTLIEGYEENMADAASFIIEKRREILTEVKPILEEELVKISQSRIGKIDLDYKPGMTGCSEDLLAQFKKERSTALRRGYTTIGPQRDDWHISRSEGPSLHDFVSRGELKMVLIALKIAEARHLKEKGQHRPVLLFDDLLSELDSSGRLNSATAGLEGEFQLIFTGTEKTDNLNCLRDRNIIEIGND